MGKDDLSQEPVAVLDEDGTEVAPIGRRRTPDTLRADVCLAQEPFLRAHAQPLLYALRGKGIKTDRDLKLHLRRVYGVGTCIHHHVDAFMLGTVFCDDKNPKLNVIVQRILDTAGLSPEQAFKDWQEILDRHRASRASPTHKIVHAHFNPWGNSYAALSSALCNAMEAVSVSPAYRTTSHTAQWIIASELTKSVAAITESMGGLRKDWSELLSDAVFPGTGGRQELAKAFLQILAMDPKEVKAVMAEAAKILVPDFVGPPAPLEEDSECCAARTAGNGKMVVPQAKKLAAG